jgi:4-hydroxy-tetrahydrodipicolinate synthase
MAMVTAARAGDWVRVHQVYARFAALIVFEQQPGVAVRKELLRRRGLFTSARARHPGATITPSMAGQLDALLERTMPGVDITKAITVHDDVAQNSASRTR